LIDLGCLLAPGRQRERREKEELSFTMQLPDPLALAFASVGSGIRQSADMGITYLFRYGYLGRGAYPRPSSKSLFLQESQATRQEWARASDIQAAVRAEQFHCRKSTTNK
jgi:hypothetical protein